MALESGVHLLHKQGDSRVAGPFFLPLLAPSLVSLLLVWMTDVFPQPMLRLAVFQLRLLFQAGTSWDRV